MGGDAGFVGYGLLCFGVGDSADHADLCAAAAECGGGAVLVAFDIFASLAGGGALLLDWAALCAAAAD
jgi:hypothetical protein